MWMGTMTPFTYEGWWSNEPSGGKIETICIFNKRGLDSGWNDVASYKKFYVLCEFPYKSNIWPAGYVDAAQNELANWGKLDYIE